MLEAILVVILAVALFMAVLVLVNGLIAATSYWDARPHSHTSFDSLRTDAWNFRSIIGPALAALLASAGVGTASGLWVDAFRIGEDGAFEFVDHTAFNTGLIIFMFTVAAMTAGLTLLLRGQADAAALATFPQSIALAAREFDRLLPQDDQRSALKKNLWQWVHERGERALGLRPSAKRHVQSLARSLFADALPQKVIPLRTIKKRMSWRDASIMVRAHPWRIGWVLLGPATGAVALGGVVVYETTQSALSPSPFWFSLGVFAVSCVGAWSALWGRLVTGRRRYGNERFYLADAVRELRAAEQRAAELRARDERLASIERDVRELLDGTAVIDRSRPRSPFRFRSLLSFLRVLR